VVSDVGGSDLAVYAQVSPQQCSGEYEFAQQNSGANPGNGQGFSIMIP
jgi:hypothetical protein